MLRKFKSMGNYSPHANYKCKCYLLYAKPQGDNTSHLSEFLSSKRAQTTNVGWWVGKKRQPLYTVGGTVNLYSHCGIVWKKKAKNRTTMWPSSSTPRYISKNTNSNLKRHRYYNTQDICKEHPTCPSRDERIKKMWGVCVCVCVCVYRQITWTITQP